MANAFGDEVIMSFALPTKPPSWCYIDIYSSAACLYILMYLSCNFDESMINMQHHEKSCLKQNNNKYTKR